MSRIEVAFGRLRASVTELIPGVEFLPGADEQRIALTELALGMSFPPELRDFLTICGGQPPMDTGPLGFLRFLTPAEILRVHTELSAAVEEWAEPAEQPSHFSNHGYARGWIPWMAGFQTKELSSFDGDTLMVDTEPGELGFVGQVFLRPNVPDLEPPTGGVADFLEAVATELESGDYRLMTLPDGSPLTLSVPSL